MPRIKDQLLAKEDSGDKEFTLTEYEWAYIRDLNRALLLHTLRSQIVSGFLTYVATTRLGYTKIKEGHALQYELDPKEESRTLIVREVPVASGQSSEE